MASSNQGGSILSFLIIGGVLTAALVGGAYIVQQRATNTVATPVVTQPADKATTPAADDKKVAVEQNKDAAKKEEAAKQEAAKKAEAQKQEAAKKEAAKPAAPAQTTPPATAELPKTGPAESASAILGVGLLSYMIVNYVRSRSRSVTL